LDGRYIAIVKRTPASAPAIDAGTMLKPFELATGSGTVRLGCNITRQCHMRHTTFPQPVGERQQIVREGLEYPLLVTAHRGA
jgi:hypothetical protein